jgi:trimeric autotransporter adhesin
VAASSNAKVYFHEYDGLNGNLPEPPVASFSGTPSLGSAPLTVQFTDTSTGTIDTWAWDFDTDGNVDSTAQNPSFTYTTPNTYTATLTVSNSAGSSSTTRTITVTEAGGTATLTFRPTDDAYVRNAYPDQTSGSATTLRVYTTSTTDTQSYLRFVVSGVSGSVTSAKLRLFVVDASAVSGSVYGVPETPWSENTITWNNRPPVGALIVGPHAANLGTWVEFDLTGAISADGTYSLALKDATSGTAWYSSKEGTDPPQLVLTVATP